MLKSSDRLVHLFLTAIGFLILVVLRYHMKPIFIIEHLEPELYEWCLIEYKHISKIVGKATLWFTNIKIKDAPKLRKYGKVIQDSIKDIRLKNACLLDLEAKKTLAPESARKFNYFIFGGILGDYPPRNRTKEDLSKFMPSLPKFNIGREQMSTDNAVYVVKQIRSGRKIKEINFKDKIEIKINKIESTILPYRYALINNKPLISKDLIRFLKRR